MLRQRRQLRPDYWPPASATTLKRLHHHPTPRTAAATRWSVAGKHASTALTFSNDDADISEEEQEPAANSLAVHEDDSPRPRRWSVADGNSSELMMMIGVMGCGSARRDRSSLGSCAGEPATPSPICSSSSPMSSLSSELCCGSQVSTAADLSFATANQSLCIMSDDGVEKAAAREGILQHPLFKNHIPVVKMRGKQAKGLGRGRGGGGRPECMSSMTSCSLEGERRLPTVGEEDWRRRSNLHHCSTPLLSSSSDDHYCSNSSSFGCEYESSGSIIQVRRGAAPAKARWRPNTASETRMKAMQELVAWKEARTMKLMKKLEEEEASIDAWVKKKTTKAKMEMKQLERRLEKKRDTRMEKMQRKITVARNKAEKKKAKEREAANQSISAVSTAFEKKLTGKAPWRLLFL